MGRGGEEHGLSGEELTAFVFIDIAVIIIVARLMGALFRRIRQPAVVGEIIGGILLGPTLLGALPGGLDTDLFPLQVRPHLGTVAQLGLIIFMFIVGMELDLSLIRGKERMAAVISLSSVVLPFGLGILLAVGLHSSYDVVNGEAVELLPFALFIGASMSITAFPVLARILTDRGMYRTQIGALTLASAAVDDVLAWSLLAVVLAVVASSSAWDLPRILLLSIAFVVVMFAVVRPLLGRVADWYRREGRLTPNMLAIVVVGFLVAAFVTSKIGIHAIFGAFTFGAVMPRNDTHGLFQEILERLENVSVLVLLPVFFVATGLNVDVTNLDAGAFATLALILVVACAGKLIGATIGARSQGIRLRKSLAVGVLMNTRGLTELVILGVGREFGILHDELFTLLVVMAIFTTVITEPLLRLVYPDKLLAQDVADAQRAALGLPEAYRVIVLAEEEGGGTTDDLVAVALDLVGDERPSEIVLTRFTPAGATVELGAGLQAQLDAMATSMDELGGRAREVEARGISAVVFSQFSPGVARDVVEQCRALDADVLVVGAGGAPEDLDEMVREAPADVVVAAGTNFAARNGAVWLDGAGGAGAEGAVEVASRLARARRGSLVITDRDGGGRRAGQRLAGVTAVLEKIGVPCSLTDAEPDGAGVRVAPLTGGGATADLSRDSAGGPPTLWVRSRAGFDRKNLEDVAAGWQVTAPERGEP